ncbi:MAG: hypothetical protein ACM359_07220 [Bacillota bacterium]
MTTPPPLLDYAPQAPWYRRRRLLILAAVLAMLLGASFLAHWGWSKRDHWQLLLVQRRCMHYLAPPGTVVFRQPADLQSQDQAVKRSLASPAPVPTPWNNLRFKCTFPPGASTSFHGTSSSHGTLFLHQRTSPAGNTRLVIVDLNLAWAPRFTILYANKMVVQPASLRSPPKLVWAGNIPGDITVLDLVGRRQDLLRPPYGKEIKCLFGQPDPADASHFTIDILIDGQTHIIDGWLRDDDTVMLKVRSPAATQFSPTPLGYCPRPSPGYGWASQNSNSTGGPSC